MVSITIEANPDKKSWESFLQKYPEANFLQSWYWGEFHNALGSKIYRTGFLKEGKLVGIMLSVVENARRGRYLTIPGGPLIDWEDQGQIKAFVEQIKTIAKEEECVFVRVRPQLKSDKFSKDIFKKSGFKSAPLHLHAELTSQLDITKPEEDLLASMRKATRYEVKKAMSLGIKIKQSTNPKDIEKFYEIQLETSKRQKFIPFSYKFLYEQFRVFSENGKAVLFSAELENELLAQAFIIFYGNEAAYHYGASTEEGRKFPGSYLIQWEAIKEAKKRGIKTFNFWGVAPLENTDHRFSGLSTFKRGFGGEDIEYLHAQDLIINYPRYLFNYIVESIRKRIRNI